MASFNGSEVVKWKGGFEELKSCTAGMKKTSFLVELITAKWLIELIMVIKKEQTDLN